MVEAQKNSYLNTLNRAKNNMQLKIKRMTQEAHIPVFATAGAAAFDLHALMGKDASILVNKGTSVVVPTGLAFEIPYGYVLLIFSRSGHGFKQNVRLANCVGVIDSDYRGQVFVKLTRDEHDGGDLIVRDGDRIAQGMLVQLPSVEFIEVDELSDTARGAGGFGSTGA